MTPMLYVSLCTPVPGGGCDTHGRGCPSPGKAPIAPDWPNAGTTDRPENNAGVVCGAAPKGSGVLVIDVDTEEGAAIYAGWELPDTLTVKSGRADGYGAHYYFAWPDGLIKVPARLGGPRGPELKGNGRQVVAAGSKHHSGGTYKVVRDLPLADLPAAFVAQIVAGVRQSSTDTRVSEAPPEVEAALERLLEHFADAEIQSDGDYCTTCPAHADNDPSLVITATSDRLLLFCRAGCKSEAIMAAVGLDMRYLWPPKIGVKPAPGSTGPAPTTQGHPRTDAGNALRLVDLFGDQLRYVPAWRNWIAWDGTRWVPRYGAAMECAKATARNILDEAMDEADSDLRAALAKWAVASENATRLDQMCRLAQSDPRIHVAVEHLDAHPWLLNCQNGTVDLKTGELLAHDPSLLLTRIVSGNYDPAAAAPAWSAFLERVLPDEDTRAYVQRVCGLAMTGENPDRVLFVFHGDGRNGKSLISETMQELLGSYAGPINKDALIERKSGSTRNDLADARGKRLVVSSENEEGERLSVAEVKAITGGDTISVRRLYENNFAFRPEFKVWLLTNYLPRVTDPGVATWDRLRPIPFTVRISDQEMRPREEMLASFRAEADGILAWCLAGCAEWRRIGLAEPAEVVVDRAAWQGSEDVVGQFLTDATVENAEGFVTSHEIYKSYTIWCVENGHRPMSLKRLSPMLQLRGMERCREGQGGRRKGYCGRAFTEEGERLARMTNTERS